MPDVTCSKRFSFLSVIITVYLWRDIFFLDTYHTTFPLSSQTAVGVLGIYKDHTGHGKTNKVVKGNKPNLPFFFVSWCFLCDFGQIYTSSVFSGHAKPKTGLILYFENTKFSLVAIQLLNSLRVLPIWDTLKFMNGLGINSTWGDKVLIFSNPVNRFPC